MVMYKGGKFTKTIPHCHHSCADHQPVSDQEVLDPEQYWNLDFDGTLLPEGGPLTLLYAKAAWPTLKDAQEQWRLEQDAHAERSRPRPRPSSRRVRRGNA